MFISIDGIDGAGKTTLAAELAMIFEEFDPLVTKEPTDTSDWGIQLRSAAKNGRMPRRQEIELFHKDRVAHLAEIIRPALRERRMVICDRYVDSTLAFQARSPDEAEQMYQTFLPEIDVPDITFILSCSVDIGLVRVAQRREGMTKFERREVLERASKIYDSRKGSHYAHVDATGTIPSTVRTCLFELQSRFPQLRPTVSSALPNYHETSLHCATAGE